METIDRFTGEHRWLSNFWPVELPWGYPSVEHAYQAAKTKDYKLKDWIRAASDAGDAKTRGRSPAVKNSMIDNWDDKRTDIMYVLLRQKFFHLDLRTMLLATYPAIIIEGNRWGDTFWGMCNGKGENRLGTLLMRVRGEYMFASICATCRKRVACADVAVSPGQGVLMCEDCAMCRSDATRGEA